MKNKYKILIGLMLISSLILTACGTAIEPGNTSNDNTESLNEQIEQLTLANESLTAHNEELELELNVQNNTPPEALPVPSTQSLWNIGQEVMALVSNKNMNELSTYVDPTLGLRFTPYVYTNITFDQRFTPQEVANLPQDTTEYNWGYYYGTPTETEIIKNFNDYYYEFVYDEDFTNTNIVGVNAVVSYGDIIDNIDSEYPNAEYLEYYVPGTPHNNGTYWKSLKLVFEVVSGEYKLVGIIHGQWSDVYGVD